MTREVQRVTVEAALFRNALSRFATGVTVITARDGEGRDHGLTVSAFSSLSLQPPLVLVCIADKATLSEPIAAASHFGVSVLADAQEDIARRFAEAGRSRFEGVSVRRGAGGVALLDGALAQIECRIVDRHAGGDHSIVIGEVVAAAVREGRPLLYSQGDYARLAP